MKHIKNISNGTFRSKIGLMVEFFLKIRFLYPKGWSMVEFFLKIRFLNPKGWSKTPSG